MLTTVCASMMATGLFYAARQHFSTIDFGLKNSKLRKQIEDLESERRRLVLAKEVSLSPAELTRNAHSLGFREAVRVPPATPIDEQKESLAETKQQPVQISVRETKTPDLAITRPDPVKKLVKPVVDQGPVRSNSPNERPRVVGDGEKRVASLSVKSF